MKNKLLCLLIFIVSYHNLFAQTHRNEIGGQTDNDSYLAQGSDRYYTDGIFFYFRHALKVKDADSTSLYNKVLGFETGQKIFNAQSGYIPNSSYLDRPFAAYLYVGSTLNLLYKNESNLKLGVQVGMVGPAALGEPIQKFVHNTFGFYSVNGWQYQIRNDLELNLSAEYNKLITRAKWIDLSVSSYANLGNGFSGAGLGPLVRMGNFNQLFNSVSTQSTSIRSERIAPLHANEFFFYYKPQFNYIAYDATIQGSLFKQHDPTSLEIDLNRNPLVFSQQFGVAYTTRRFIIDVTAIFHSKDVKEMVHKHQWGGLTLLYRFN